MAKMKTQYTQQAQLFGSKFVAGGDSSRPILMIADPVYCENNESAIYEWMMEHLTDGVSQHEGMCIWFNTEQQRLMFLLKWG
jgi:hypothetical protein